MLRFFKELKRECVLRSVPFLGNVPFLRQLCKTCLSNCVSKLSNSQVSSAPALTPEALDTFTHRLHPKGVPVLQAGFELGFGQRKDVGGICSTFRYEFANTFTNWQLRRFENNQQIQIAASAEVSPGERTEQNDAAHFRMIRRYPLCCPPRQVQQLAPACEFPTRRT